MKIIHTSDWHIGKVVNQVSMLQDQIYVLDRFLEILAEEKPDVLIIAGDIYDRAVPPVEAVELMDKVLSKITLDMQIPIMIVAGNHDSPDRLGFGSGILQARKLYIEGRFQKEVKKIVVQDDYGPVNFYLVPYAPPAVVRDSLALQDINSHQTAMQAIVKNIKAEWQAAERNILITHAFVRGADEPEVSDSEKPLSYAAAIGGVDCVDVNVFEEFTYTALGHLHRPQQAGNERVRYAGSLLKYSFSEIVQKKAVTIVEVGADGDINVVLRPVPVLRDMRHIKGELQRLTDPVVYQTANVDDYLYVTLTDDGELLEPMSKLRMIYTNVLAIDFAVKERQAGEERTAAGIEFKKISKVELFGSFYEDITGKSFSQDKSKAVGKIIQAVEIGEQGE